MPVKSHYQVAFLHEGETRYGVVESLTVAAKKAAETGELIVADAILPKNWVIEEKYVLDVDISSGKYEKYVAEQFAKDMAISDKIDGCAKGKIMRFHVNNRGYAYYVITKVTKTLVHLEWRGYTLDKWVEPVLSYFGKMNKTRAEKMIKLDEDYRTP